MSTRKGASSKKGPPKHQNKTAFKNDLHHKEPMLLALNSLQVRDVCQSCKSKLEWKIKFKKFKPRSSPGTCTKCSLKTVKHAYHILCLPCAREENVCPKCKVKRELVNVGPTPEEQMKLDNEMKAMLTSLSERKRRTFLRYMERNSPQYLQKIEKREKKAAKKCPAGEVEKLVNQTSKPKSALIDAEGESERKYLTKSDLMAKLEALKLSVKDDDDDEFDSDDDSFEITDDDTLESDE